ncbi:MAG: TlpA disulfide reductase family protein [Candidatus Sulfopaludibacter sp.]|nr:TlpA disulfide reductase family protein [Candidatus Sulfopaludibacter sp.]
MSSQPRPLWQRDGVQLAGILAVGVALTLLFRMDVSPPATGKLRNPDGRKSMPDIASTDLRGNPWRLSDHKGEAILVNVWASWCPPCREETPGFVRVAKEYEGNGFEVVGVSADEGPAPVRRFVDQFHVPYPVILPGADSPLIAAVESLPTSFLLDRQGRVATVYVGAVSERQLRGDIARLLEEH